MEIGPLIAGDLTPDHTGSQFEEDFNSALSICLFQCRRATSSVFSRSIRMTPTEGNSVKELKNGLIAEVTG